MLQHGLYALAHTVQTHRLHPQRIHGQFQGKARSGLRAQIQQRGRVRQLDSGDVFYLIISTASRYVPTLMASAYPSGVAEFT